MGEVRGSIPFRAYQKAGRAPRSYKVGCRCGEAEPHHAPTRSAGRSAAARPPNPPPNPMAYPALGSRRRRGTKRQRGSAALTVLLLSRIDSRQRMSVSFSRAGNAGHIVTGFLLAGSAKSLPGNTARRGGWMVGAGGLRIARAAVGGAVARGAPEMAPRPNTLHPRKPAANRRHLGPSLSTWAVRRRRLTGDSSGGEDADHADW